MKNILLFLAAAICLAAAGCNSNTALITKSTGNKNVSVDGYVMYGAVHAADPSTAMPTGKMIVGRLVFKSRKVGIPADQQVPNTGSFKSTWTKSLFGTEEHIVEYDFTAGNKKDAAETEKKLEKLRIESSTPPQK